MELIAETAYILDNQHAFSAIPPALAAYVVTYHIPGAMMYSNIGRTALVQQSGNIIVRDKHDEVMLIAQINTHGELLDFMSTWLSIPIYQPSFYRDTREV